MPVNEKPWLEIPIDSWEWFDRQIEKFKPREWLFRGHSDSCWRLRTSLDRSFDDLQHIIKSAKGKTRRFDKRTHESLLIKTFQKNANLYLDFLPPVDKKLEWLAIMQHHGAPTRLLDVTLSPHIATYFALEAGSGDSCIFAINHTEIKKNNTFTLSKNNYKEAQAALFGKKERFVIVFDPEFGNKRLVIQQGLFLVPSQINQSFDDLLEDYLQFADDEVCIKYIIPARLRFLGLERLRQMNITSSSLFPGLDGFSKSLKFQILETVQSQKLLD